MPYGYTVSLWVASATAGAHFGSSSGSEIFAFAAGAILAFLLFGLVAKAELPHEAPKPVSSAVVLNVTPLPSLAVAPQCLLVPAKGVGFAVASFAVTIVYAVSVTLFLQLTARAAESGTAPPAGVPE